MVNIPSVPVLVCHVNSDCKLSKPEQQNQSSFRAARLVGDATRFLIVTFPKKWSGGEQAIKSLLQEWQEHGVNVHGSRYAWLGYSDNHVKSGKVVLFHENEEWSSSSLLAAFGDVYGVFLKHGYGKYAARFGLSFSSTLDVQDISDDQTVLMEDLRAQDGSLHTDGCGMIRDSFASQLCALLNLPPDTSVFQIRRGGYKGLLIRYLDRDFEFLCNYQNTLLGRNRAGSDVVIAFRESMLKYEGGPTMLEINDYSSRPNHARLNEGFILLLLTNGVSLDVFRKLLLDQLALIGAIANDRDKALKAVGGELDASSTAFHQDLYTMLLANHDLNEPYMAWKLSQFQQSQLSTLHKKLNIAVESSAYLFGVVDEHGVLEPNEVFVNIPGWTGVITKPQVLVGRNPSYSPGDLRVFKAVYHEKLTHLNNCIVFSRRATHSVPDTMASGDLDGDEYLVIWDSDLVPPIVPAYEQRAESSSAVPSGSKQRSQRTQEDFRRAARETFLDHHHNFLLGSMVTEWKRRATGSPQLANDKTARKLQPLIEKALDAMKSGADMSDLRRQFEGIKALPGRRDKFNSPLETLRELVPLDRSSVSQTDFVYDPGLIVRDQDPDMWEKYLREAPDALKEFNRALGGAILLDKEFKEQYGDDDKGRWKSKAPRHAELVTERYRSQWFGGGTFADMYLQRIRASAWYWYGYSVHKKAFAWLGMKYLNEIRAVWTNGGKPVDYIGATCSPALLSPAPSPGSTQISRQSTLVADELVEDEGSTPPEKLDQGLDRSTYLASAARDDELSVARNPKPLDPVASRVPHCNAGMKHKWNKQGSKSNSRVFRCRLCGVLCKEKDVDGRWQADPNWGPIPAASQSMLDNGGRALDSDVVSLRSAATIPSLVSDDSSPSSSSPEAMIVDDEDDPDVRHSPPPSTFAPYMKQKNTKESLRLNVPGPSTRASHAVGVLGSQIPSLASSDQCIQRESISDSVTMPGGIPPSVGTLSDLVHENEKPKEPVARDHGNIPHQPCPSHSWHLKWAGRGYRYYDCSCGVIVKEKKSGGRWVSHGSTWR